MSHDDDLRTGVGREGFRGGARIPSHAKTCSHAAAAAACGAALAAIQAIPAIHAKCFMPRTASDSSSPLASQPDYPAHLPGESASARKQTLNITILHMRHSGRPQYHSRQAESKAGRDRPQHVASEGPMATTVNQTERQRNVEIAGDLTVLD